MDKLILLTKSIFRKNRSTSIGLFLLIVLAATVIGVGLLLLLDTYPTAGREAKRLQSGDGYLRIENNLAGVEEAIPELLKKDVEKYNLYHCLSYSTASVPFGDGNMCTGLVIADGRVFSHEIDRMEIVEEERSITDEYIILPYQFRVGGVHTGDTYTFELYGHTESFRVRGFMNSTYFGCSNNGSLMFVLDDENYKRVAERDAETADTIMIAYYLKDGRKAEKFQIAMTNKLLALNADTYVGGLDSKTTVANRTFMSLILAVSLLVTALIMLVVIILMLGSSISNVVQENMQTVGTLKAVGYTSKDIRSSLALLFCGLALIGSILGVVLSYVLMPLVSKVVVGQMGIPYTVGFNFLTVCISLIGLVAFVYTVTVVASRIVKKIEPIIALRNGATSGCASKNHVALDASPMGLNASLSMKTVCTNKKQNIISFIVVGCMVFMCVLALLMYENFSRNPKLSILTFETCGGVLAVDVETREEAYAYLNGREEASNLRELINLPFCYKEETTLNANIMDDISKMNNKEVCYKGRLPEGNDEIAVSGKFASDFGFAIGDEVPMTYGGNTHSYKITGLIQSCNNAGREAVLSKEAAKALIDVDAIGAYIWFDCEDEETAADILSGFTDEHEGHILSSLNFYEIIDGSLTLFRSLAAVMMFSICGISALIILLVMYLLIKALIYRKRRDYGIYKAIGFTGRNLIVQTALSFMPSIILSVIVFSVASYLLANPYMSLFMGMFGLMKCNFTIPILGTVIIGIGMLALSFVFALLSAGKIRKIEPINLITE